LSPLTEINDPLLNSLSVSAPRFIEKMHLDFGLHVEHHIFPALSSAYAPLVRDAILERWPERYQSMPIWRALQLLFSTPRVYEDAVTLIDPRDGRRYSTLLPVEEDIAQAS
jgi:fatty acid desaturase